MAKKSKRKAIDPDLPIYQVKITLEHTSPPIWRQVEMDDVSLDELHEIIQAVMGWEDMHPHVFDVDGEEYGNPELGGDAEYDSRYVRLSEIVEQGHTCFRYEYDFGDDWQHAVDVERTLAAEEGVRYPRCVAGERACPPEDCGGVYGYEDLLRKLRDPEDEEHEEAMEWLDEFDPEEFDLEAVNKDLYYLRRWLGKRRGKHVRQAAFGKGDWVRVKPGVVHDQYPDIPLGGWVGRIKRISWLTPVGYTVDWTKATIEQAHPVYLKRCNRDELPPHRHWLAEDQLEATAAKTRLAMEQPTNLASKPLSRDDPEDRIRAVFGLSGDDPLPNASQPSQQQYLDYLRARLSFPFHADYPPASELGSDKSEEIVVLGFADAPLDRKEGIVCKARKAAHEFDVPLQDLRVREDDRNFEPIEDYTFWIWEVDREEEEGSVAKSAQFPIGTIAYYGPDDKTTTKIAAGVIKEEGARPIIRRWVATDVTTNPKVQREIDRFFKKYGVKRVGMSAGNMGCPHEEGKDFPVGGDCPFCPWWKGKQGSGARE